ncbi:hypothetical protein [Mycolicibacter minnesotensis]|jgi:hypothetical protein|nr:MAG: hypothetical protein E6R06_03980 [Mycobacterium sp.]
MDDVYSPYGAADARTDAARLRRATAADALDLVYEIRNRLMATEGARRPDIDTDYIDASDALVIADELVKAGATTRTDLKRLADEMIAAAAALDELVSNKKSRRATAKNSGNPIRTANQIWKHDGKASK